MRTFLIPMSRSIAQVLSEAKKAFLRVPEISDTPKLDAELLLAAALHVSREALFAHSERLLSGEEYECFQEFLQKRIEGFAIDHILGEKEFFGLSFRVTPAVLTPRPETEILVEKALVIAQKNPASTCIDLGTGSGCIAITLARNLSDNHAILAVDISEKALKIATENATALGEKNRIQFLQSDVLQNIVLPQQFPKPLIIIANLPYVRADEPLPLPVQKGDPAIALFGGEDGLDLYRRFFLQIESGIHMTRGFVQPDFILCEFDARQQEAMIALVQERLPHYQYASFADLAGKERFLLLEKKK